MASWWNIVTFILRTFVDFIGVSIITAIIEIVYEKITNKSLLLSIYLKYKRWRFNHYLTIHFATKYWLSVSVIVKEKTVYPLILKNLKEEQGLNFEFELDQRNKLVKLQFSKLPTIFLKVKINYEDESGNILYEEKEIKEKHSLSIVFLKFSWEGNAKQVKDVLNVIDRIINATNFIWGQERIKGKSMITTEMEIDKKTPVLLSLPEYELINVTLRFKHPIFPKIETEVMENKILLKTKTLNDVFANAVITVAYLYA